MLPKWHILLGAFFSVILYFLFPVNLFQATLFFLSSFLIDVDHYLFFIIRKKDFSLKNAYLWFKALPRKHKPLMVIFHTVEFILFIAILSYFFRIFFFVLLGLLFHSLCDIIDLYYFKEISCREFSIIKYLILKNKKQGKYF